MDRLLEDSRFSFSAHPLSKHPQPSPAELIESLERALRGVVTLPGYISPVVAFAQQALADVQRLNAASRLASISAYVAYKLGISHEQLMSKARTQHVAFCRQVAMYVCRSVSGASFPAIGEHFNRDHSTAIHAFNLIDKRVNSDPGFRRVIDRIKTDLGHLTPIAAVAA